MPIISRLPRFRNVALLLLAAAAWLALAFSVRAADLRAWPLPPARPRGLLADTMLRGVYPPLAAKARTIAARCGAIVISGVRHTRVAGRGTMSLHASGHAVDMRGNPGCIYATLRGWPGGYSTDYRVVGHVHISLGGREDGLRFAHGGHRRFAHGGHGRRA